METKNMRQIILTIVFLFVCIQLNAQLKLSGRKKNTQYDSTSIVQVKAIFVGGESRFRAFVYENFEYPMRCYEEGINGRVVLRFVVDETGKISNVQAIEETKACPEFTAEAIRVMEKSTRWIPGQNNGKFVKSYREIPITVSLSDIDPESISEVTDSMVKASTKQENNNIPQNASDAVFPGGNAQFGRYIMDRIVFPMRCKLAKINGKVMAKFIVNVDGKVSNVEIIEHNYLCPEFSKEAIRVIMQSPLWTPAMLDGKPVKCFQTIPIKFVVEEN